MNKQRLYGGLLAAACWAMAIPGSGGGMPVSGRPFQGPPDPELTVLLEKLTAYAARLEGAVLDFVCREEISEKISYALDQARPQSEIISDWAVGGIFGQSWVGRPAAKDRNDYVYDYQCVRDKNRLLRETRTLLEENGKKKNEPAAKLKTQNFVFGTPLLGPVGIFAGRYRDSYEYKIVGREKAGGRPAVVIEADPTVEIPGVTNLYGKVWVEPQSGEILKIEWNDARIGRREIFEQRGERYKLKPRIRLRSEFSAERNGIRFPSRLWIEEAYLSERGRAFVRSETTVTYKDFKFFTVEVGQIDIR
jgi:hypothetical protein